MQGGYWILKSNSIPFPYLFHDFFSIFQVFKPKIPGLFQVSLWKFQDFSRFQCENSRTFPGSKCEFPGLFHDFTVFFYAFFKYLINPFLNECFVVNPKWLLSTTYKLNLFLYKTFQLLIKKCPIEKTHYTLHQK